MDRVVTDTACAPAPAKHARILQIVRCVPAGNVASYGMISSLVAGSTPRIVGFALAGLALDSDVPWQRIINASGGISPRPGSDRQRFLLELEGIAFSKAGKISWAHYAWPGPDPILCDTLGLDFEAVLNTTYSWPGHRS